MTDLVEHVGVLHVHTAYSDGGGRMPYVIDCAKKAGLDYVVLSDHNDLRARRDGWGGWHESVLLVAGVEVTSKKGHALVIGLDECGPWQHATPDEYLPEVARLGGVAFIAHPEGAHRGKLHTKVRVWPELETECYAGIEIWSYIHDWFDWFFPWHPIAGLRDPDRGIVGPHAEVLRSWDEVALRRHVSGVGALDAHELRLPIPRCRWSLVKLLPLAYQFRTVRTHVLAPPLSGEAEADTATLTGALVAGRCFTAYDLLADVRGARFTAHRGGEVAVMGDEIPAGGKVEFRAETPHEAEITLLRNGEAVAETTGRSLVHGDDRPGVYRVEARLAGRPWVFTNHIYVR